VSADACSKTIVSIKQCFINAITNLTWAVTADQGQQWLTSQDGESRICHKAAFFMVRREGRGIQPMQQCLTFQHESKTILQGRTLTAKKCSQKARN
jgi:hypothetical protein